MSNRRYGSDPYTRSAIGALTLLLQPLAVAQDIVGWDPVTRCYSDTDDYAIIVTAAVFWYAEWRALRFLARRLTSPPSFRYHLYLSPTLAAVLYVLYYLALHGNLEPIEVLGIVLCPPYLVSTLITHNLSLTGWVAFAVGIVSIWFGCHMLVRAAEWREGLKEGPPLRIT